jgi:hypothetical protein
LEVKKFLDGTLTLSPTPRLYCNDKWLDKLSRWDVAYEGDSSKEPWENGNPMAIAEVPAYKNRIFLIDEDGDRHELEPYWSEDLDQYLFDDDYKGKTYCSSQSNLGATQEQTTPKTITICPKGFTNPNAPVALGDKEPKGLEIASILPRSATLYHELFHLVLGNKNTPDVTCK